MIFGMPRSVPKSILPVSIVLVIVAVGAFLLYFAENQTLPEVKKLSSVSWTSGEYKNYFVDLAKKKGAVYAFRVLREADIAFGVDVHLIGHEVGYVLYAQEGVSGLGKCTDRFRGAACAHAIVIQEFVHEGSAALERLANTCAEKPIGSFGHADCLHGLGHGIVAYLGYDFERAIGECKKVSDIATNGRVASDPEYATWYECVDGATMEMLQGNHDKNQWEKAKPLYLPDSDVFMPCDASFMSKEVQPACYAYIRARILRKVGRTKEETTVRPDMYKKALSYCARIPEKEMANRNACYGGFGVDFVYFVNGYDDRKFKDMADETLLTVHDLCALAGTLDARSPCTLTASDMILSRGEGLRAAGAFCRLASDPIIKDRCYSTIVNLAEKYLPGEGRRAICTYLPENRRGLCSVFQTKS